MPVVLSALLLRSEVNRWSLRPISISPRTLAHLARHRGSDSRPRHPPADIGVHVVDLTLEYETFMALEVASWGPFSLRRDGRAAGWLLLRVGGI